MIINNIAMGELVSVLNFHAQILVNLTKVAQNTGIDDTLYSQIEPHLARLKDLHAEFLSVKDKVRQKNTLSY